MGPSGLSRFDHEVIAQPGVGGLIVAEGINDIGMLVRAGEVAASEHSALVRQMIGAYPQPVARAHRHALKVVGATRLPFVGSDFYHPGPESEADRRAVNQWIRTPGHFDEVIDFDQMVRDPAHPERLLPAFDSGDHLHPSAVGDAAMAEGVPLSLLAISSEPAPQIAITFDDLPAHGPLPKGETRVEVIAKVIAAWRQANLPPVYGLVNGERLRQELGDHVVLQAWRAAGNLLGNHAWSHMNLNQHFLGQFEQDVLLNQPLLAELMKNQDWRWFRYPYLAEGDTDANRKQFRDFLGKHDYKVAAVTMSYRDYLWNEPYVRCAAQGNLAAIAWLEKSYLNAANQSVDFYRGLSHWLYGRNIRYVLLMHVGAFDAEMIPRLLELYRPQRFGIPHFAGGRGR